MAEVIAGPKVVALFRPKSEIYVQMVADEAERMGKTT